MQEGEGPQKVKDRLMAFKVELTKDLANLEALLHTGQQLSKPMVKEAKQVQVDGQQALKKGDSSPQSKHQKGSCD